MLTCFPRHDFRPKIPGNRRQPDCGAKNCLTGIRPNPTGKKTVYSVKLRIFRRLDFEANTPGNRRFWIAENSAAKSPGIRRNLANGQCAGWIWVKAVCSSWMAAVAHVLRLPGLSPTKSWITLSSASMDTRLEPVYGNFRSLVSSHRKGSTVQ